MIYVVWALGYGYLLLWAAELAHWDLKARELLAQIHAQRDRVGEFLQSAIAYRYASLRIALRQARQETRHRRRAAKWRYLRNPPTSAAGLAEALRYQDSLTKELP